MPPLLTIRAIWANPKCFFYLVSAVILCALVIQTCPCDDDDENFRGIGEDAAGVGPAGMCTIALSQRPRGQRRTMCVAKGQDDWGNQAGEIWPPEVSATRQA